MKFSYKLLKKLVPKIKNKSELIEKLLLHAFEAEDLGGDTIDIAIPSNRYSDAASHWGMASVLVAIFGDKHRGLTRISTRINAEKTKKGPQFRIKIKDKNLCPRYIGWYFEVPEVKASPKWMQEILISCGLQPINNVVDIMNYAMLETGQPLHAFDFDKIESGISKSKFLISKQTPNPKPQIPEIIVRRAKKGEKITTLDGDKFELKENMLVIADSKEPLAIAGIKGGKKAEISRKTKKIIVEAASFEPVSIYKTSRQINLTTEASLRFSHGLSPTLAEIGIRRAAQLLKEICKAEIGEAIDINTIKISKKIIKFDIERFNKLTGLNLTEKVCLDYIRRLGFEIKKNLIEIPAERADISIYEDLIEEITKLYGYNRLPSYPPAVYLKPSGFEELVGFKDKIRNILSHFGLNEVYNYSFIGDAELRGKNQQESIIELENPISKDKKYLRFSLMPLLHKNVKDNFRFYDDVRIFEIGKVFLKSKKGVLEKLMLGVAIGFKKGNPIPELKGLIEELLKQVGLIDHSIAKGIIRSDNTVLGWFDLTVETNIAFVEIDVEKLFELAVGEKEFEPLPKYPSVVRDLSILVPRHFRVDEIMAVIENSAPKYLDDVDLIDIYEDPKLGENRQSLTFRLVFLAEDHTLTNEEVGKEMEKIISSLEKEFDVEIR